MREILFRAKAVKKDTWLTGYPFKKNNKYYMLPEDSSDLDLEEALLPRIRPKTLRKFIGTTDRFGEKIFEGDIIKIMGFESIFEVRWCYINACFFYVDLINGDKLVHLNEIEPGHIEVIGMKRLKM